MGSRMITLIFLKPNSKKLYHHRFDFALVCALFFGVAAGCWIEQTSEVVSGVGSDDSHRSNLRLALHTLCIYL